MTRQTNNSAAESALYADLVQEDRFSGRLYTDPAIFAEELRRIWYRTWVYVGHESEIPRRGDYKATKIGLQPVIVSRASDSGVVNVLFNRCRHRASIVCGDASGNANYFRCPYHGWTYSNDGALVGVPYREGYGENFDEASMGLIHVARVDSYRGFVFASLSESGPGLHDHLGNALPYIDKVADQEIDLRAGIQRYVYDGNWKLQQENTVDNYHAYVVHKVFFDIVGARDGSVVDTALSPGNRSRDLGNGHGLLDLGDGNSRLTGSLPFNLEVFPNLNLVGVQVRVTFPVAVDKTLVELYPTLSKTASDAENAARLRGHEEFYGPAGFGGPDDVDVVMRRVPEGLAADQGNDWIYLAKGLNRQEIDPDTGVRSSHVTDELPQQAIYREWRSLMSEG